MQRLAPNERLQIGIYGKTSRHYNANSITNTAECMAKALSAAIPAALAVAQGAQAAQWRGSANTITSRHAQRRQSPSTTQLRWAGYELFRERRPHEAVGEVESGCPLHERSETTGQRTILRVL